MSCAPDISGFTEHLVGTNPMVEFPHKSDEYTEATEETTTKSLKTHDQDHHGRLDSYEHQTPEALQFLERYPDFFLDKCSTNVVGQDFEPNRGEGQDHHQFVSKGIIGVTTDPLKIRSG